MTEELGGSELPTGGSASLFKMNLGIQFSVDLCVAAHIHTVAVVMSDT